MVMAKKRRKPGNRKRDYGDNPWPEKLFAIRERLGLTQTQAAEMIGTVLSTWQNWEYGRRQPNDMLAKLIKITFPE